MARGNTDVPDIDMHRHRMTLLQWIGAGDVDIAVDTVPPHLRRRRRPNTIGGGARFAISTSPRHLPRRPLPGDVDADDAETSRLTLRSFHRCHSLRLILLSRLRRRTHPPRSAPLLRCRRGNLHVGRGGVFPPQTRTFHFPLGLRARKQSLLPNLNLRTCQKGRLWGRTQVTRTTLLPQRTLHRTHR